ncbi:Maf-like protein YceF [Planctomycetes bacterium Pan216]|uniref:7-methyl-GTP pyrophosphatase n=1 Tax=Kolteria novifilia TaxID=2527975 RepID=A0A518AX61_9BACT|nr:Maf-like protein YceF [Planctomycetes bacterium Pan216]
MSPSGHHPRELILASTSVYRRQLIERLGVPFRTAKPVVDEVAFAEAHTGLPNELAEDLARAKAENVLESHPDATIIGGDQLVEHRGKALGKPGDAPSAIKQLLRLAGEEHRLITAMVVLSSKGLTEHTDLTTLRMRSLSRSEIERYVERDQPFDCAGSYKLEAAGITLFENIRSTDQTAIVGLPLIALTTMLRDRGFRIP